MSGFPIEEAFVAPGLAVALTFGSPALARRATALLLPEDARPSAEVGSLLGTALAVVVAGREALGPALVNDPRWSWAFVGGLLALVLASGLRRPRAWRPLGGLVAGLALGIALSFALVAAQRVARVEANDRSEARAWWSVRLEPWHADGYVSAAWLLAADSPERARAVLALGERAGAEPAEVTRLRAELAAVEGDCETARELYGRAIVEHAEAALMAGERLELGGVPVPEQLALRCGLEAE